MSAADRRLIAYQVSDDAGMQLTTSPLDRDWMEQSSNRFAYRCLPLNIANQAGWVIANPVSFSVVWDGGQRMENLRIDWSPGAAATDSAYTNVFTFGLPAAGQKPDPRILSHFGEGVLTFTIPFLFRTPPGINLWVKGPTNHIKDGVQALEGIVETDWSAATFTMNWKLTRPGFPVLFEKGEPICMVVPVQRGLAESLTPERMMLSSEPALEREYLDWEISRRQFNQDLAERRMEAVQRGWQRDYTKGVTTSGTPAPEHQTRLGLKEFVKK